MCSNAITPCSAQEVPCFVKLNLMNTVDNTDKPPNTAAVFLCLGSHFMENHDARVVKAIQLQFDGKSVYTSCSGTTLESSQTSYKVEIGRIYGEQQGLTDGQEVVATPLPNVISCEHVTIIPLSESDWQIAEHNTSVIESVLINQVRVIWKGAVIPVWVHKYTNFVVKVDEIHPSGSCVQLEEHTKVEIVPRANPQTTTKSEDKNKIKETVLNSSEKVLDTPIVRTVKHTYNLALGRSLHQVGDKYVQSYSPVDPYSGIRVGVVNFVKSVLIPQSADEMKGTDEKTIYPLSNKPHLHGLKGSDESDGVLLRSRKALLTQSIKIPIHSFYRVQDLAPASDVIGSRKSYARTQSLPRTILEQPSTVFVYCAELFCAGCRLVDSKPQKENLFRNYFVMMASIQKVYSVKERIDTSSSGKRSDISSNESTPNDEFKESDPVKLFERKYLETMSGKQRPIAANEKGNITSLPTSVVRLILTNQQNMFSEEDKSSPMFKEDLALGHIAVNRLLRRQLKIGVKSSIRVKTLSHGPSFLMGLVLNPFGEDAKKVKSFHKNEITSAFTSWILETTKEFPLVLSSRMLIAFHITPDIKCEFLLSGIGNDSPNAKNQPYYFVCDETLKNAAINVGDVIQPSFYLLLSPYPAKSTEILDQNFDKCPISSLGGFQDIYKSCLDYVLHGLSNQPVSQQLCRSRTPSNSNTLLIYGSGCNAGGSGKTSLGYALCNQLGKHPVLAHIAVVDCIALRGKRVETIRKSWQATFSNAAWHENSVVLFDDVDQLLSAPSLTQENSPEAQYILRLAQVFKDFLMKEVRCNSKLVVIATANSRDSIHPSLLTSHGNHVFNKTVEISLPNLEQRCLMLNAILRRKSMVLPNEDVRTVAVKTEGCSPKDLNTLVARAYQVATIRLNEPGSSSSIFLQDFTKALQCFKPASLHGIKLHHGTDLSWQDVGGLNDIKTTLRETLEWPAKYPDLFTSVPMRLPSGILLYGPPGTGKTMLAGVVASECSLNFISIKGPELLSKYIGASEQAVRDLFERAQSAKPCVLFFDEFDSMAPRRGHDSTGVTDRVVNQLLTQLDGVEGLDGVYILAATSRPDLIDPALLRPGRLDKSLYCGMPNEKDRLEILTMLSAKLNLHPDVDLEVIAKQTDDFSGADLKALLSNAQLERIHEMKTTISSQSSKPVIENNIFCMPQLQYGLQEVDVEERAQIGKQVAVLQDNFFDTVYGKAHNSPKPDLKHSIAINQEDIMKALTDMNPSVSPEERNRYNEIYQSFQGKKSVSRQMASIIQRATLA